MSEVTETGIRVVLIVCFWLCAERVGEAASGALPRERSSQNNFWKPLPLREASWHVRSVRR